MNHEKYSKEILKTGFKLEYDVSAVLQSHSWQVINGRYYVDDQSSAVREIDIVAYRAVEVDNFSVYTVLLISCKKSADNIWAFLAKPWNDLDPNTNLHPLSLWTNVPSLQYMRNNVDWQTEYLQALKAAGVLPLIQQPGHQIFAFQELNRSSGTVHNDRPIFQSVESLMKAQSYEMGALPNRQKKNCIYQFNLISVADTSFARLLFSDTGVGSTETTSEIYFSNYILNGRRTDSRVHFVTWASFELELRKYDSLHRVNTEYFETLAKRFYADVVTDRRKAAHFEADFNKAIRQHLWLALIHEAVTVDSIGSLSLTWDADDNYLVLEGNMDDHTAELLNHDDRLQKAIGTILLSLYRYDGNFRFGPDGLPF